MWVSTESFNENWYQIKEDHCLCAPTALLWTKASAVEVVHEAPEFCVLYWFGFVWGFAVWGRAIWHELEGARNPLLRPEEPPRQVQFKQWVECVRVSCWVYRTIWQQLEQKIGVIICDSGDQSLISHWAATSLGFSVPSLQLWYLNNSRHRSHKIKVPLFAHTSVARAHKCQIKSIRNYISVAFLPSRFLNSSLPHLKRW